MKHMMLLALSLLPVLLQAQPTDEHFSHTERTTASPDRVWKVWTDVPNWKQWDKGLKEARLEGPFAEGVKGRLVPDRGPASKFIIEEIVAGRAYTVKTRIPLGWLVIRRSLVVEEGQTSFTHDVEFTGLLKKVLGKKLGRRYRALLPDAMREIKQIAEAL